MKWAISPYSSNLVSPDGTRRNFRLSPRVEDSSALSSQLDVAEPQVQLVSFLQLCCELNSTIDLFRFRG